ncbi:MAG: S1 RNA-binding domain-containing protein [Patescibacteria group bacterium]
MASQKSSLVTFRKGDIIEGKVTKITSGEIRVDINAKAEAVVLEKDKKLLSSLLASFKLGDTVSVQILNVESEMGHPVVSLRRFLNNKLWGKISEFQKNKTVLDVTVNDSIKGGLLVTTTDGISGFLPNSQISFAKSNDETPQIESKIKAIIIEADRNTSKIIFSQSQAVTSADFIKQAKALKTGERVKTTVTNVTPYGLFVSVPIDGEAVDGLIHVSELSWDRVLDINSQFSGGDTLDAQVIGFDEEARRVNLSIKKLKSDPFDERMKDYPVDKKVTGKIIEIRSNGAVLDLGEGMQGTIKKDKIPPTMTLKTGDSIDAVVSNVDTKRRRLELTPVLKEKPLTYR